MTVIRVPVPAKNSFNLDRPVSGLLKAQILHLQGAEKRLPLDLRSNVYINAIKTEGEAAEYIRQVTEAVHEAHAQAAQRRAKHRREARPSIEIAAAADEPPVHKTKKKVARRKPAQKKA
jgi:beta-phosphoglucomutase-like phosphatase (HAD superfamily)